MDVIYAEYTLPRNDRTLLTSVSVCSLQEMLRNEYIYVLFHLLTIGGSSPSCCFAVNRLSYVINADLILDLIIFQLERMRLT